MTFRTFNTNQTQEHWVCADCREQSRKRKEGLLFLLYKPACVCERDYDEVNVQPTIDFGKGSLR